MPGMYINQKCFLSDSSVGSTWSGLYQPKTKRDTNCNEIGCNECKRIFMEDMEKDIRKAVRRL